MREECALRGAQEIAQNKKHNFKTPTKTISKIQQSVTNFDEKPAHLSKHSVLGITLPSLAHIMNIVSASPGVAEVKVRGQNGSEVNPNVDSAKTLEDEVRVHLHDENVRREKLRLPGEFENT